MNTSAAFKWRITNAKYIYITDEWANGPFIYNLEDDTRVYQIEEVTDNGLDEAMIKRNVSAMDESGYAEAFDKMSALLKTDDDGQYLQLLDYTAYMEDLKECTEEATEVTCNPMDINFEVEAETYPSDEEATVIITDIIDDITETGTKKRTFYITFGIPKGEDGIDGEDGETPTFEIKNGYWYVNGEICGPSKGADGNSIRLVRPLVDNNLPKGYKYFYIQLGNGKVLTTKDYYPNDYQCVNVILADPEFIELEIKTSDGNIISTKVEASGYQDPDVGFVRVTDECYIIEYTLTGEQEITFPQGPQGATGQQGPKGPAGAYEYISETTIETEEETISQIDIFPDVLNINSTLNGNGKILWENGDGDLTVDHSRRLVRLMYDNSGVYSLNRNTFLIGDTITLGVPINSSQYNPSLLLNEQGVHINSDENIDVNTEGNVIINSTGGEVTINASENNINVDTININATSTSSAVNITGSTNVNGSVRATAFYSTSDVRLKNILEDISLEKAYDLIDKCSTIVYSLKDDISNREQIGLIAQEVEEFFPEIVSTDLDGFKSVDYARITVIILKVLKDLIKRIEKIEQ